MRFIYNFYKQQKGEDDILESVLYFMHFIISNKEIMFSIAFVCLSVSNITKKLWTDCNDQGGKRGPGW